VVFGDEEEDDEPLDLFTEEEMRGRGAKEQREKEEEEDDEDEEEVDEEEEDEDDGGEEAIGEEEEAESGGDAEESAARWKESIAERAAKAFDRDVNLMELVYGKLTSDADAEEPVEAAPASAAPAREKRDLFADASDEEEKGDGELFRKVDTEARDEAGLKEDSCRVAQTLMLMRLADEAAAEDEGLSEARRAELKNRFVTGDWSAETVAQRKQREVRFVCVGVGRVAVLTRRAAQAEEERGDEEGDGSGDMQDDEDAGNGEEEDEEDEEDGDGDGDGDAAKIAGALDHLTSLSGKGVRCSALRCRSPADASSAQTFRWKRRAPSLRRRRWRARRSAQRRRRVAVRVDVVAACRR
jgi:hypothetical protein